MSRISSSVIGRDAATGKNFDWKIILLMDHREFNHTGFLDEAQQRIDKHFNGKSPLDRNEKYPLYCEKRTLVSADYMFVARKIDLRTGKVLDERVLDLIIERKNVNDLQSCLINKSKMYVPLTFFEAQMYKLQQCGIPRKVFLIEGDEDDPRQFYTDGTAKEHEKRLKRVKTLRVQVSDGEYKGITIECTRTRNDSLQYLVDQMEDLKRRFNPLCPPTRTMRDVKKCIDRGMEGVTFQEYLRLRLQKGTGNAKAMKTIRDPKNGWDTSFISPDSSSKNYKSTLEDRATFYIISSGAKLRTDESVETRQRKTKEDNQSTTDNNRRNNHNVPQSITRSVGCKDKVTTGRQRNSTNLAWKNRNRASSQTSKYANTAATNRRKTSSYYSSSDIVQKCRIARSVPNQDYGLRRSFKSNNVTNQILRGEILSQYGISEATKRYRDIMTALERFDGDLSVTKSNSRAKNIEKSNSLPEENLRSTARAKDNIIKKRTMIELSDSSEDSDDEEEGAFLNYLPVLGTKVANNPCNNLSRKYS